MVSVVMDFSKIWKILLKVLDIHSSRSSIKYGYKYNIHKTGLRCNTRKETLLKVFCVKKSKRLESMTYDR